MLIIKDAPIIGQQSGTGLIVPGAPVFGGGGNQPDYSPIDMTSATPDRRIRYQCASQHAYWGADGLLHYAGPDEYPVEYIDGVALGRHEPEPQRTNLVMNNTTASLATGWGGNRVVFGAGSIFAPDGSQITSVGKYNSTSVNSGIFYRTNDASTDVAVSSGFSIVPVNSRAFIENLTAPDYKALPASSYWQYWTSKKSSPPGAGYSGTVSVYSTVAAILNAVTVPWGWQFEFGNTATSPILTSGSAANRLESSVFIKVQGATGLRVHYTTGDFDEYSVSGDEFQLPLATHDWGYRYISTIEYMTG